VARFFGNLYEAVVDMPQLLSDARQQRRSGLMAPGSPLRCYAPIAPLTLVATTAALMILIPDDTFDINYVDKSGKEISPDEALKKAPKKAAAAKPSSK